MDYYVRQVFDNFYAIVGSIIGTCNGLLYFIFVTGRSLNHSVVFGVICGSLFTIIPISMAKENFRVMMVNVFVAGMTTGSAIVIGGSVILSLRNITPAICIMIIFININMPIMIGYLLSVLHIHET